jgi:simple sugar transport system ATP-binding protein
MELLGLNNIHKVFPSTATVALDGVDFTVKRGEVHALVGENGAGKSTLARIMCGLEQPSSGSIVVRGQRCQLGSFRDAERAGIGLVPQNSMLAANLTVAENIALGHEPRRWGLLYDHAKANYDLALLCSRHGFRLDPDTAVADLSNAQKREAEILRALARGGDVLILDEPTSILAEHESTALFGLIRRLKSAGAGIVYISHRAREILDLADRITVLRNGRVLGTMDAHGMAECDLAELIVQASSCNLDVTRQGEPGSPVLVFSKVSVRRQSSEDSLTELSLSVHSGEIVGIVALGGNGLDVLEDLAAGLIKPDAGTMLIQDRSIDVMDRRDLRSHYMGYLPTDREGRGLCRSTRVRENILAKHLGLYSFLDYAAGFRPLKAAEKLLAIFGIVGSTDQDVMTLSGGNRQRLMAARELARPVLIDRPDGTDAPAAGTDDPAAGASIDDQYQPTLPLIIAANPAQGLDISARDVLFKRLLAMRNRGSAILLLTTDLDELAMLADRSYTLYRGRLQALDQTSGRGGSIAALLTGAVP